MSISRTDPPDPPEPPRDDGEDGGDEPQTVPTAVRPRLDDRQTLDRRTIDDSFARKCREFGLPAEAESEVSAAAEVPYALDDQRDDQRDDPGDEKGNEQVEPPGAAEGHDPRRRVLFALALLVGVSLALGACCTLAENADVC